MIQGPDEKEAKVLNLGRANAYMYEAKNTLLLHILMTKEAINKHETAHIIFHRLCQAKCRGLYKRLLKNPIIFWKSSDAHSWTVLLKC